MNASLGGEGDGPSLLEQMMAEGMKAKANKEANKKADETRMKKNFGSGLKGGFFASSSPPTNTTIKSKEATRPTHGGTSSTSRNKDDSIPTVTPLIKKKEGQQPDKGLVLPEVQAAMQESTPPALRALQSGEWMTPELLDKITSNPRLLAGLQSPRCAAALQEMQQNPQSALAKYHEEYFTAWESCLHKYSIWTRQGADNVYLFVVLCRVQDDSEVGPFLMEFCKLMGDHFTDLGAKEQEKAVASSTSTPTPPKGPLVEKALKKHQEKRSGSVSQARTDGDKEQEERVKQILADPELRELLMDPQMQGVLQECGQPGKLMMYMQDPTMAIKIRKLAQAGLVQIQS